MTQQEKFFSQLKKYLNSETQSKRFIEELKDHIEDKTAHHNGKKNRNTIKELGDPKLLALLWKLNNAHRKYKLAKTMSVMVNIFFISILYFAIFNEDGIYTFALPFLTATIFSILSSLIAWHWRKVGGTLTIVGAIAIFISVNINAIILDQGIFLGIFVGLLESLPFLAIGFLFRKSHEELYKTLSINQ